MWGEAVGDSEGPPPVGVFSEPLTWFPRVNALRMEGHRETVTEDHAEALKGAAGAQVTEAAAQQRGQNQLGLAGSSRAALGRTVVPAPRSLSVRCFIHLGVQSAGSRG